MTMHIVGPVDGVYWAKQGFRNAVAKAAGAPSTNVYWYRVRGCLGSFPA